MENVVIKATAKDIKNRYTDVEEMMTDVATSTSLDRRGEEKLVFNKDHDETKIMPANLINPYDTNPLIDKKEDNDSQTDEKATSSEVGNKNKKSKKGLIIGLIILLLVVGGATLAWVVSTPTNVKIPNVTNSTLSQAKSKIKDAKLKVGTVHKQQSSTIAEGKVIKTDPTSGTTVRSNSSVDIYVSTGNEDIIKMKDFVGEKIDEAMATLLKDYGIDESQVTQTSVPSDSYPAGTIIKQSPKKGSSFDTKGSEKITFEVSSGKQVEVPDYKPNGQYMTYSQYQAALKAAGFTNITLDPQATTNQQADGYVYSVYPNVGTSVDPTQEIVVTYSVYTAPSSSSTTSESTTTSETSSSTTSSTSSSTTSQPSTDNNNSSKESSTTSSSS